MAFNGFSKETLSFLTNLERNNEKKWFEANRQIFDQHVMADAELFVLDLGERLREFAPQINAIPKTDKSIFRIYRDIRFSKDKRQYKSHLALLFWEGSGKKMESPGFYFHLEPKRLFLAAGMHIFTPSQLSAYRDAVVDDKHGAMLEKIINMIRSKGDYQLGWKKYKKVPRGYAADHPRAELLLYGGVGFSLDISVPKELMNQQAVEYCYKVYKDLSPIHVWLSETIV
jgi:uncharacterized protein (TIGR02453 family)